MMMMRNHIVIMIGASAMVQAVGAMSTAFLRCYVRVGRVSELMGVDLAAAVDDTIRR